MNVSLIVLDLRILGVEKCPQLSIERLERIVLEFFRNIIEKLEGTQVFNNILRMDSIIQQHIRRDLFYRP